MNRWETLAAIVAVVVASAAALPIPGRLWCALAAIAVLIVIAGFRVAAVMRPRSESDAAARARRIREQRKRSLRP